MERWGAAGAPRSLYSELVLLGFLRGEGVEEGGCTADHAGEAHNDGGQSAENAGSATAALLPHGQGLPNARDHHNLPGCYE